MSLGNKKPGGLLRFGFRLPIWLFRLHMGWVLGERFLLLTHVGRKSGSTHQTVIEIAGHDRSTGTYYVVSGFGRKSDWYLNIKQHPNVTITVKQQRMPAQVRQLTEAEGARILQDYANRHPTAFRELSAILTGKSIDPTEENLTSFVRSMPVVGFEPIHS